MKRQNKILIGLAIVCVILIVIDGMFCYYSTQNKNVLKAGEHLFPEGLKIEGGETLEIKPGAVLKMGKDTIIDIRGRIVARGTAKKPIIFTADDYWRGVKIQGELETPDSESFWPMLSEKDKDKREEFFRELEKANIFEYVNFSKTSTESRELAVANKWKSTIEAYDTSLVVKNSSFQDILHIGAVLTQRSYVLLSDNLFKSETLHKVTNFTDDSVLLIYNNTIDLNRKENARCADGFWVNNSTALIYKNKIKGTADDAIDSDTSHVLVMANVIESPKDDGVDIDNEGFAYVIDNKINGVNENAILISDKSKAVVMNNEMTNSESGLTVRDGARVGASDNVIEKNQTGVLVFQDIPCVLKKKDYEHLIDTISKLSEEEVKGIKSVMIESPEDFVAQINSYYREKEGYYNLVDVYTDRISSLKVLKEAFKFVDLFSFEHNSLKDNAFCQSLENTLYLANSSVKDNLENVGLYHEYNVNFEAINTDTALEKENLEAVSNKDFVCEITDSMNLGSVEASISAIISEL
ncbi:hypothetical protein C0584_02525 [Candidatus Parcubacteria bacterium]|nr:MAG: hypothetical protein C0584_02525 [Candidatus Parcubacteria bacterium]